MKKMKRFGKSLEDRACNLIRKCAVDNWGMPIPAVIEREIALALSHIKQQEELHDKLNDSLLQMQCYVDTELMQMEDRTPRYSPYRFPEREKLQRSLLNIEKEQRSQMVAHQDKIQGFHDHLLKLLNRHMQIKPLE